MKRKPFFFYGGSTANQEDIAKFKKENAEMALRGELSSNELHKRAEIGRVLAMPALRNFKL